VSVVVDTGAVLALMRVDDDHHGAARELFATLDDDLVTSPLALAEMDHLVGARGGRSASEALWRDLERGAYTVRWWADALDESLRIVRRHPFLGLTDASLVALAGRLRTTRIATFEPHFRSIETPQGDPFTLCP
jgi:hypothetical protein